MKKYLGLVIVLAAVIINFSQTGCKENIVLKSNLAPNIDNIYLDSASDTLTIYAKTVNDSDTLYPTSISYNSIATYHGIGNISSSYDVFGSTNASAYFQVIPSSFGTYSFGADSIDSAVLVLPYSGFTWGDTTDMSATQTYVAYRLADTMSTATDYYPTTFKKYDGINLLSNATKVTLSQLRDSVYVDGANQAPHVRIRLNDNFLNIIEQSSLENNSGPNDFLTNSSYGFFGFYVATIDNKGKAIPYFTLYDPNNSTSMYGSAGVLVYHHTPGDSEQILPFYFNPSYCAHFNRIIRNYSPYIQGHLNTTAPTDSVIFLQNEAGLAIDIQVPYVKNLPSGVVNKAQLIITQENTGSNDNLFTPPPTIYVTGIIHTASNTDSIYSIADAIPASTYTLAFMNGNAINTGGTTQYILNIPREVQASILNQRPLHLLINGTQDYPGAYRLKAGGSGAGASMKVQLKVYYSKPK